jgi:hypothetical protein
MLVDNFDGIGDHLADVKQLEGVHASSATFVEVFMSLWGLWREKVDAGSAAEMARVKLPEACIPEWLGALSIPTLCLLLRFLASQLASHLTKCTVFDQLMQYVMQYVIHAICNCTM